MYFHENSWIAQIFNSHAARNGGIVRRSVADVLRFSSPYELKRAVEARGFYMILFGDQYVIFCSSTADLQLVC
jgi:hypothetical protein